MSFLNKVDFFLTVLDSLHFFPMLAKLNNYCIFS